MSLTYLICGKVYCNIPWVRELKLWNSEDDFCKRNNPCMHVYVHVSIYNQFLKMTNLYVFVELWNMKYGIRMGCFCLCWLAKKILQSPCLEEILSFHLWRDMYWLCVFVGLAMGCDCNHAFSRHGGLHKYVSGLTWYCKDRVSSCNIYAVQKDTQSFLMSEFIHHIC